MIFFLNFSVSLPELRIELSTKNTGNIAKQTLSFNGLAQPFVQAYKFDSLYRLTEAKVTQNGTQTWKQNWGYDRYGNRNSFTQDVGRQQLVINNLTLPTAHPLSSSPLPVCILHRTFSYSHLIRVSCPAKLDHLKQCHNRQVCLQRRGQAGQENNRS